jgi:hypothetical protein
LSASANQERLIDIGNIPQAVPFDDTKPSDDVMDAENNPLAQQFGNMIDKSSRDRRQELINRMNEVPQEPAQPAQQPNWFMGQSQPAANDQSEAVLSARLAAQAASAQSSLSNLRAFQPAPAVQAAAPAAVPAPTAVTTQTTDQNTQAQAVTTPSDPAILSLAKNDDLNVSTLAREANRAKRGGDEPNEVVISLH